MISDLRTINYLRISITDRCNFRCQYCMPCSPFKVVKHALVARYEEILKITQLSCELGITKVRITGGEPFARRGVLSFLEKLTNIQALEDISITTNGALLTPDIIRTLSEQGIKRLNFSLDTLDPEKFKQITGKDDFLKVWDAIMAAYQAGMSPIKINAVALKDINEDEIEKLARLTLDYPFHVRFIEYMPMGGADVKQAEPILAKNILKKIETVFGKLSPVHHGIHDGPAKKFRIQDAMGVIGLITPISSHFCNDCNRLRLTARGTLRPCLLDNYEKDILNPIRNNASDDELKQIIISTLKKKPSSHHLASLTSQSIPISHMTSIGG